MSLPVYPQYVLPPVAVPAGILEFRLNTDGSFLYTRALATDTLFLTYPQGFPDVLTIAKLKKKFNDKDGDISADTFGFTVYDVDTYYGREGDPNTGTLKTETLTDNNFLFDKIFSLADTNVNPIKPILFATLITPSGRECFFIGIIDVNQIARDHVSVFFGNTTEEVQTRELDIQANDIMTLLSTLTIQNFLDFNNTYFVGATQHTSRWNIGIRWDNETGNWGDNIKEALLDDSGASAYTGDTFTGVQGLTLQSVLVALNSMYATIPISNGIDSAFDFYSQETTPGNAYPLTKFTNPAEQLQINFNTVFGKGIFNNKRYSCVGGGGGSGMINVTDIWMPNVGNRVVFDANITPLTSGTVYYVVGLAGAGVSGFQVSATSGGSPITITGIQSANVFIAEDDFPYTNSLDRNSTCLTLLSKLFWQFGCIFYNQIVEDFPGLFSPHLTSISRRTSFGNIPSSWNLTSSKEEPHYIPQTTVIVSNENDSLKLMAGTDENNALQITIPFRAHQWGSQTFNFNFTAQLYPDNALWFDPSLGQYDQKNVSNAYYPPTPAYSYADGWYIGKFLWKQVSNDIVYSNSAGNRPGHPAMVNMAAMTIKGQPTPGDNDDYYNTLRAAAIFYYQEICGNRIVLTRKYDGITADDGTIQGVRPGLETILPIRTITNGGLLRTFRGIETEQNFLENSTSLKFIERPSDYSALPLPTINYLGTSGSSTSTSSQSQGGSGSGTAGDNASYVSTAPQTDSRNNKVLSKDVIGESTVAFASQTKDLEQYRASDNTTILSGINKDGSLFTNVQTSLRVNPYGTSAGNTGEARWYELLANGTNYVALKAPDALAANNVYVLPNAFPSIGTAPMLLSDHTGNLSWIDWNALITVGSGLALSGTTGSGGFPGTKVDITTISLSQIQVATANSVLLGSGDTGIGLSYTEITLGSGLTMTGTTLSASGGMAIGAPISGSGTHHQDVLWIDGSGNLAVDDSFSWDSTNFILEAPNLAIANGNININGVQYVFPGSHGAANSVLTEDGSGNLSWSTSSSVLTGAVILAPTTSGRNLITSTSDILLLNATSKTGGTSDISHYTSGAGTVGLAINWNGYLQVGDNTSTVALNTPLVVSQIATQIGSIFKAAGSGTAHLLEIWDSSSNVKGFFDINGTFFSQKNAIGVTVTTGIDLQNTSSATGSLTTNQQISPAIQWHGSGWKTAATAGAQPVDWYAFNRPTSGSSAPSGDLVFAIAVNGGTIFDGITFVGSATGGGANIKVSALASGVVTNNNGLLSSSPLTATNILYATSGTAIGQSANFTWDNTNKKLILGVAATASGTLALADATGGTITLTSSIATASKNFIFRDMQNGAFVFCTSAGAGGQNVGGGTLAAGTAVINTSFVAAGAFILITPTSTSAVSGILANTGIVAGVSFTVTSTNALDANTFSYVIVNP